MNKLFTKKNNWLLDLDNTLYPSNINLFEQIDEKMKEFISSHLRISEKNAFILQKKYYLEYGTTLRGLMINDKIEPESFLNFVHDIDITLLASNPKLSNELDAIEGKKIIFTNGSSGHAERILNKLSIKNAIDGIFDIRMSNYIPKPNKIPYLNVIANFNLDPSNTVMVDDIPTNLKMAKELGIKTILIDNSSENELVFMSNNKYPYIDLKINNLTKFLNIINNEETK